MERKSFNLRPIWRREWDLNPRTIHHRHTISNRARSAAPPSLQASLFYMIMPKKAIVFEHFFRNVFIPSPPAGPRRADARFFRGMTDPRRPSLQKGAGFLKWLRDELDALTKALLDVPVLAP